MEKLEILVDQIKNDFSKKKQNYRAIYEHKLYYPVNKNGLAFYSKNVFIPSEVFGDDDEDFLQVEQFNKETF